MVLCYKYIIRIFFILNNKCYFHDIFTGNFMRKTCDAKKKMIIKKWKKNKRIL